MQRETKSDSKIPIKDCYLKFRIASSDGVCGIFGKV